MPDKSEKKTKTFLNKINGVTYRLGENPMGIKEFQIRFAGKEGDLKYINSRGEKTVHFGTEDYKEFLFPEYYNGERLFDESCKKMYRCIGKCIWVEPHKLMIKIYAVDDYIGNLTMVFSFKGDEVGVKMAKNAQFFFHGYEGYAGGWALK